MRMTIDLPEHLHGVLVAIAHDRGQTLSETITDLLGRSLMHAKPIRIETEARTGLPIVRVGRPVTREDVRSLEDDG